MTDVAIDVAAYMPAIEYDTFSESGARRGKRNDRTWTKERVEALTAGWARGDTAACIALDLGPIVTRNAVLGKVFRLKLPNRKEVGDRPLYIRPRKERGPKRSQRGASNNNAMGRNQFGPRPAAKPMKAHPRTTLELFDAAIPRDRIKSLMDRQPGECCWPIGDPRQHGFGYCCAPAAGNGVDYCYCPDHLGYMTNRFGSTGDTA